MTKTMSIRMDEENYEFISDLSIEERDDLSKTVRELVYRGRVMLGVEKYKNGEVSLGRAADLAGIPVGRMIDVLAEYGVKANLEQEDYLDSLKHLKRAW
ncbi:MAG: UPF0175 family protein [Acidobacteria bacterium]|nr:UPF0175 family protein [Acidobacteriota bacterium]